MDAPDVMNDFYHNPLDWSADYTNKVAVALSSDCYLLGENKSIDEIMRYSSIPLSSVKFFRNSPVDFLLAGDTTGRIELHDLEKNCKIRQMNLHYSRVGVIEHFGSIFNPHTFLSGSKDKIMKLSDIRLKNPEVKTFERHEG